jgi:adenosylcobinamide-phosphate synthase
VFGSRAAALEKRIYRDSRWAGLAYTTVCVGAATAAGLLAERMTRARPIARTAVTAAATWAVLGGTTLGREGTLMAHSLQEGDLVAARARLPHLCGRDPSGLDAAELARGTVESIAENTSDAVVAPLVWGAVFGVPGLLGYRAVNTLDAMVGHRSPRYERFGWASARLDDVANYVPARLTALLTVGLAGLAGGSPRRAAAVLAREEQHAGGVAALGGQLELDALAQELVRELEQDARAVARVDLRAGGAPVLERVEHAERALHGFVRGRAGEVGDRADSTGVVFESRVVEAHGLRSLRV